MISGGIEVNLFAEIHLTLAKFWDSPLDGMIKLPLSIS